MVQDVLEQQQGVPATFGSLLLADVQTLLRHVQRTRLWGKVYDDVKCTPVESKAPPPPTRWL